MFEMDHFILALKEKLREKGLSQKKFCSEFNNKNYGIFLSESACSKLLGGNTKDINASMFCAIADYLDMDPADLASKKKGSSKSDKVLTKRDFCRMCSLFLSEELATIDVNHDPYDHSISSATISITDKQMVKFLVRLKDLDGYYKSASIDAQEEALNDVMNALSEHSTLPSKIDTVKNDLIEAYLQRVPDEEIEKPIMIIP